MNDITINGINYTNVPNKKVGTQVQMRLTQTNVNGNINDYMNSGEYYPTVNAIDIDWNGADLGNGTYLNTTSDLINYVKTSKNDAPGGNYMDYVSFDNFKNMEFYPLQYKVDGFEQRIKFLEEQHGIVPQKVWPNIQIKATYEDTVEQKPDNNTYYGYRANTGERKIYITCDNASEDQLQIQTMNDGDFLRVENNVIYIDTTKSPEYKGIETIIITYPETENTYSNNKEIYIVNLKENEDEKLFFTQNEIYIDTPDNRYSLGQSLVIDHYVIGAGWTNIGYKANPEQYLSFEPNEWDITIIVNDGFDNMGGYNESTVTLTTNDQQHTAEISVKSRYQISKNSIMFNLQNDVSITGGTENVIGYDGGGVIFVKPGTFNMNIQNLMNNYQGNWTVSYMANENDNGAQYSSTENGYFTLTDLKEYSAIYVEIKRTEDEQYYQFMGTINIYVVPEKNSDYLAINPTYQTLTVGMNGMVMLQELSYKAGGPMEDGGWDYSNINIESDNSSICEANNNGGMLELVPMSEGEAIITVTRETMNSKTEHKAYTKVKVNNPMM